MIMIARNSRARKEEKKRGKVMREYGSISGEEENKGGEVMGEYGRI